MNGSTTIEIENSPTNSPATTLDPGKPAPIASCGDWEAHRDSEGYQYYWNRVTLENSWDPPAGWVTETGGQTTIPLQHVTDASQPESVASAHTTTAAEPVSSYPAVPVSTADVPVVMTSNQPQYAPTTDVPSIEVPMLEVPMLDVPSLDVPSLDVPSLDAPLQPVQSVPSLDVPSLDVPSLYVPSLEFSGSAPPVLQPSSQSELGIDCVV